MYKPHTKCRACGYGTSIYPEGVKATGTSEKLISVLDLGVMPLSNAFRKAEEPRPGHYPLELLVCPRCHLGQLSAVVDPGTLYSNYLYVTSPSEMMRQHLNSLWKSLNFYRKIETIVEIGSNDGLALDHFRKLGADRVMGIDPAENLVKIAQSRGVNTICSLFNPESAHMAARAMPPIDLVLARHVFCHCDDWEGFVKSLEILCSKETIVCIEAPWAQNTIERCEFDQTYHEHLSYLTVRAMRHLLDATQLYLAGVLQFSIHGGAVCLILRRRDSVVERDSAVDDFIEREQCGVEAWKAFGVKARDHIAALRDFVRDLRGQGKRVCGWGASAKSTVWVNACGFTRKDIEFIMDNTPQKLYCTSPGTDIPIVNEGEHYTQCVDYVVLFAWNFSTEIMDRERKLGHKGFDWIIPVPELRVVNAEQECLV